MSAATPSPASGLVYADVPNRAVAYIIDAIIVFVILVVVAIPVAIVLPGTGFVTSLAIGVVGLAVGAGYFIYTWTKMRATVGMRALSMEVGNAVDGVTMTTDQGVRRFLAISAPSIVAQAFQPLGIIGTLLSLAAFAWFIFLIYTTAKSPTKQGWHDVFANTMVVKAAKSVG